MDFIVREKCSEMKALARMALRNNWGKIVLAMAIYYLLLITIPLAIDELIPGATISQYDPLLEETMEYPLVSTLYTALLAGVFEVGLYSFLIYFVRRREINASHLFDGFEHIVKALWLSIRIGFFVFLWSLLFIIPGIIAALRYSQSFAVLADHPEYSAGQCMGVSKQYMKQNKGKYFCLILSLFGWALLAAVPSALTLLLPEVLLDGVVYVLIDYVLSIPHFFFLAYFNTSMIVFYELVSRNLVAAPREEAAEEVKDEFNF
ncbi:MAG: DUF975 family protein [Firmicutes bacterium]|nr:DUF975 family protein [Bacillota bacterium]